MAKKTRTFYLTRGSNEEKNKMPKTEAEMKNEDFVTTLNNSQKDPPWKKDTSNINNGFPILSWQEE